jgi:hypothetical protein
MKEKLTKALETFGYLAVIGLGFYILYFGFRMFWILLQSILK